MNPSTSGWIDKQLHLLEQDPYLFTINEEAFYEQLLDAGFIYGIPALSIFDVDNTAIYWTENEIAKVNLLNALAFVYYKQNKDLTNLSSTLLTFYSKLKIVSKGLFFKELTSDSLNIKLEKVIRARVQTNESVLEKQFSHLITNAFLYIDVLVFKHYLTEKKEPLTYAKQLEEILMNTIWMALNQKMSKGEYDYLLVKIFEKSLSYSKNLIPSSFEISGLPLTSITDYFTKRYLLDLCSIAVYDDATIDQNERRFITALTVALELDPKMVEKSLQKIINFVAIHKENIPYFNYSNPVQQFYTQTHKNVRFLILKNKKRLVKELSESKDLLQLLRKSTFEELSIEERKRVKEQLLDICKSVPSLAIFLLPGGGLLLPLLVKFIPELLPSAFQENKIKK